MFLTFHQTKLLREYVNAEQDFGYKYFSTMTWSKEEQNRMRAKVILDNPDWDENEVIRELQKWRENQLNRFCFSVARKQNVHFFALISFELAANPHSHLIVMAEKKIDGLAWKREWRHGEQRDFRPYNPFLQHTENGCVGYVMGWGNRHQFPPKHRARMNTRVFCPKNRRRCRKGKCEHKDYFQHEMYHVSNLSREEEKQMEKAWIAAGDWRLGQWKEKQKIIWKMKQAGRKQGQSAALAEKRSLGEFPSKIIPEGNKPEKRK